MSELTILMESASQGDRHAASQLLPLVYKELRQLASARMTAESPGQTLQPTALVHEAYLRLLGPSNDSRWDNRGHFFAAAAEAMRRILVENARKKRSEKHGGKIVRHDADLVPIAAPEPAEDLLALDEALDHLAEMDPRKAELVKLRYFVGMTIDEAAQALDISAATANRYWVYSRAWLFKAMNENNSQENSSTS